MRERRRHHSECGDLPPARAIGLWRTEIALRVRELRDGLAEAQARDPPRKQSHRAARDRHVAATEGALRDATAAISYVRSVRIKQWWTGEAITAAWESIHRAEVELVALNSREHLLSALPRLRVWMKVVLPPAQGRRHAKQFHRWEKRGKVDRGRLRQAYQDVIAANVDWYASLRAFRNILFSIAAGLLAVLAGLGVWHVLDPSVLPLCRGHAHQTACFGDTSPAWTVFAVELVGMIGGLLGTAFLLGKLEHPPSRYNLLAPQTILKAVGGAATALIGVLLVQSDLIALRAGGDSTAVLLAYAAVFGFSQQLLTQFVDRRASTLLSPGGRADAPVGAASPTG